MGQVTVRSGGNVAVAIAVWIFCLVALVDGVWRGSATYIFHDVILVAAAAVAAWMVFFRPRVIVSDDGLRVINLLRSYQIPFASLVDWRVGGVLQLDVRAEGDRIRKVTSWGAPGVRKQRPALSSVMGRNRFGNIPGQTPTATADLRSVTELAIEHREREWRRTHRSAEDAVAEVTWNWLPGAVVVTLIAVRVAVG